MIESSNYPFLATMGEVLQMTAEYVEEARASQDEVRLGAYLKMASRSLRCALEIYGERLNQNRADIQQGEQVNDTN